MNRNYLLCGILLFSLTTAKSQDVQWASTVLEFSSELTNVQYSAQQLLGAPNVLPAGGESPNAWTPDRANRQEFVKVGFATSTKVRQISIGESYNPSALTNVYLYDTQGNEHLIYTFQPKPLDVNARLLSIFMDETSYEANAIKLEFNGETMGDYYSIDAIGISNSNIPINVQINLPDTLAENIVVERLSENVNSPYKEFKPLLSPDGNTLFFSRKNHPENTGGIEDPEDIWYSEKDETTGEWKLARNIGPELNTDGPNYVSSVTPDGKSVVVLVGNKYKKNGKLEAGVSISSNEGGKWSQPVALEIDNDYNYSDKAHYFLTNNREVLLMSVDRDDTEGGRDLYVTFLKPDSTWTEPKNIGANVNTAGEEGSPFLAADNKTLYFSSDGYAGYGGSDIYVTKRLDDTWLRWSDPQNMGSQINSDQEDLFFNIPVTGNFAYYSRGMSADDADIHRVQFPLFVVPEPVVAIKGTLLNQKTNQPIEAVIIYDRASDNTEIGRIKTDQGTGKFEMVLPAGEIYNYHIEMDGFLPMTEQIDLRNPSSEYAEIQHDLFLTPVEEKAKFTVQNVLFDFDRATIKTEFHPEMDRIYTFLNENGTIRVEVAGHADSTGPEQYNLGLSERRAKAVVAYLVQKGIAEGRFVVAFFGEGKPLAPNDSNENRAKNRRVEFTILDVEN